MAFGRACSADGSLRNGSEGYLVYNNPGSNKLIIWRRDDILTPTSPLDPDRYRSLLEDAHPTSDGGAVAYVPFCVLSPPTPCLATKARFPLLAAVGHGTHEVYLFNLAEGRLQSTIDISALFDNDAFRDPFATYVELDEQHVYVSGRLSTSIWTHQGQSVGTLPPSPPLALARGPVGTRGRFYRDPSTNRFVQWSAAHHGTGGKDFVAVTLSGALLWTPKQREVLRDGSRDAIQAGSVVLQMVRLSRCFFVGRLPTNFHRRLLLKPRPIVQLSVENGRAVFITQVRRSEVLERQREESDPNLQSPSNRCGLWLINLRPFDSLDDFRRDPPQPVRSVSALPPFFLLLTLPLQICLCYPLPALFTPSRVEATSTCIFVGGQSCFGPDGLLDRTFAELPKREEGGLPSSYSWYTLDGEVLAKGGRGREASRELVRWERLVRLAEAALSPEERWVDAFVMFRFGEEEGGRQVV